MGDLYLEIFEIEEDRIKAPIYTVICLVTFNYLGKPSSVRIHFVVNPTAAACLTFSLDCILYEVIDEVPAPASFCTLPVFNKIDSNCCIAGFCAVLRQLVKSSDQKWNGLLGFREACLVACAEVSVWTKFCEVDLIDSANKVLQKIPHTEIPIELARLEQHLSQPVRVHNVDKFKNKEHKYVEGPNFLLTDLLLSLPVYIILDGLQCWNEQFLPLTIKWVSLIMHEHNFNEQLHLLQFEREPLNKMLLLPVVPQESLYKRDPKRYKPRSKMFTQQSDINASLEVISSVVMMEYNPPIECRIDLEINFPFPDVPPNRLERKIQQLKNLTKSTLEISVKGDVIVDFCSGSGHLGLILAHCLPHCTIILLDNKETSLDRAKEKLKEFKLTNVYVVQANLDYYIGKFQVGVSLHACGVATDLVIQKCLQQKADFVICPCCYGAIQKNHVLNYPQSQMYKKSGLAERDFIVLGHCADQAGTKQGEKGMLAVDTDRCFLARELGYSVKLSKLVPPTCTPRNNLIVATFPKSFRFSSSYP